MKNKTMVWYVLGFVTLLVIGVLVVPVVMRRLSNKLYKASNDENEIDFENLGPEIVKKENKSGEEQ